MGMELCIARCGSGGKFEVSPCLMFEMQKVADMSLELYRAVFEKMVDLGTSVED